MRLCPVCELYMKHYHVCVVIAGQYSVDPS
jgi:hypothetical protein